MPYTVTAKANTPDSGTLTARHPTRKEAISEAKILQGQGSIVTVTDPEGRYMLIEDDVTDA